MNDWQFYTALLFLAILVIPNYEGYTDKDISSMNQNISYLILDTQKNVTDTNLIINNPSRPMNGTLQQYSGANAAEFTRFFVNKDIKSIRENLLLIQNTGHATAFKLNNILRILGSTKDAVPINQVTIHSDYSDKKNSSGDFYENDLVTLKSDIHRLQKMTKLNKNVIELINNRYYNGPLADPSLPYPILPFPLW
jgi:hypothetical protein